MSCPDSYRTVFVLREVEELSTAETAACLEVSEELVKVRLHRARTELRRMLDERFGAATREVFDFHASRCNRIVAGRDGADRVAVELSDMSQRCPAKSLSRFLPRPFGVQPPWPVQTISNSRLDGSCFSSRMAPLLASRSDSISFGERSRRPCLNTIASPTNSTPS